MAESALPDSIIEAIAISNAKSIGEQPAILANLGLANEVLNINMQNQAAITQQAALNQLTLATMARCIDLITRSDDETDPNGDPPKAAGCLDMLNKIFAELKSNAGGDNNDSSTPPNQGKTDETN